MSGIALLTYRELAKAFAFIRDSQDEDGEVIAADHPDFYCTHVNGVYRAPLPRLIDRGDADEAVEDRAEDLDAASDTDDPWTFHEGPEAPEPDDRYAAMAEAFGVRDDVEDLHDACWQRSIDAVAEAKAAGAKAPEPIVLAARPAVRKAAPRVLREHIVEETTPVAVSSRRAAILLGPKTVWRGTGPDRHCWKDNTRNGAQYLRHA